jgi:GNAT superfamily N-acetyltransferase
MLLYPLTTEMSVQGSRKRRHFPHYPLGIGWRRPRGANQSRLLDEDNAKLFEDILRSVVTLEVHTLAVEYKRLYDDVVQLVARNLAESPELYVGGVRRRAVDTFGEDSWYRESLIDQSARSYASRCLQLSQRAADEYQAHDVWMPMLRRTRQLVLQAESRRRNAIRAALRSAINVTAGLPEDAEKLSRDRFRYALRENARQLAHLLEREYEFRLPDGLAFFYRWAQASPDDAEGASFEKFLSAFQGQLEIASGGPHLVVVENVPASELRDPLVDQYDRAIEQGPASQEDRDRLANRRNLDPATLTVIRAQSLGETVGLAWVHQNGHIVHLEDLYVVEHMRSSRVSQLLIRRAIELADAIDADDVNVEIKNEYVPKKPKDRTKWFKEVGFHIDPQNLSTVLTYKVFKLSLDQLSDDVNLPKTARDVFIDEKRATPKRREGDLQERVSVT